MPHEFVDAVRLAIAGTLTLSGWGKLRDLPRFQAGVVEWDIVPQWAARPVAIGVAFAEALLAAGLVFLGGPVIAFAAAGFFAVLFIAAAASFSRGSRADCHCFEVIGAERLGWITLGRLLVLCVGALLVAIGSAGGSEHAGVPAVASVVFAVGLIAVLLEAGSITSTWDVLRRPAVYGHSHDGTRISLKNAPFEEPGEA